MRASTLSMPEVTHLSPAQKSTKIIVTSTSYTHEASCTMSTILTSSKILILYMFSPASIQE